MTVARDDSGDKPTLLFGVNWTKTGVVATTISAIIGILAASVTSGAVVAKIMLDRDWDTRMRNFHEKAIPEITTIVQSEVKTAISDHNAAAMELYTADKIALAERLSSLEVKIEELDKKAEKNNDLLWALYTKQFGATPVPRGPN